MLTTTLWDSVNPVIGLDGEQNEGIPLSEQQTKRVIDEIFTTKTRGKARTGGGIRENKGQDGKGILSQSRPRLLTSDEIFNIKKSKKRSKKKGKDSRGTETRKMMYHLKRLAKLQK